MEKKKEIRNLILKQRGNMTLQQVKDYSEQICRKIMNMPDYKAASVVLSYMSIRNEVDMKLLMEDALDKGKAVYIPRVEPDKNRQMSFYRINGVSDTLVKGSFGIMEPDTESGNKLLLIPDSETDSTGISAAWAEEKTVLVIVPGVAFDEERNRIGHGGGYYDVFLNALKESEVSFKAIGVGYDFQIVNQIPAEEHDMIMDYIVTPTAMYSSC